MPLSIMNIALNVIGDGRENRERQTYLGRIIRDIQCQIAGSNSLLKKVSSGPSV